MPCSIDVALTMNKPCVGPLSFALTHSVRWTPKKFSPTCSFKAAMNCVGPVGRRARFRTGKGIGRVMRPLMNPWRKYWLRLDKRSELKNKGALTAKGVYKKILASRTIARQMVDGEGLHGTDEVEVIFGKRSSEACTTLHSFFSKRN